MRRVAIVGGARIPFARSMGAYAESSNQHMLTAALQALVDKYSLAGVRLGDVGAGAVLKHPRDFNLTREAVLGTTLDPHTPAFDLQRACGTSLETAIALGLKIAAGQIDSAIAAGVDTASDAPIGINENLRRILLRSARGRSFGERLAPWASCARAIGSRISRPSSSRARVSRWARAASSWPSAGASRARPRTSWRSRATAAPPPRTTPASSTTWSSSSAACGRTTTCGATRTLEKLARLKPAFPDGGQRHADRRQLDADDRRRSGGAAGERGLGACADLPVQAYLTYGKVAAVDFVHGEGLLMAPAYAVRADARGRAA